MRAWPVLAACLLCAVPAAAAAQGPEQLDQLEPGRAEWQAEYFATVGPDGEGQHATEGMFGLSDRLAVGVEVEAEYQDGRLTFETLGPKLVYRFTDGGAPIAMGMQVQLGFDPDARLAEAEARLIMAAENDNWWAQGNLMLRRLDGGQGAATNLAYAWSLQHAVTTFAWFGIEASGQSAPLWGGVPATDEHGHFAGPSLTFEWEPSAGHELEIGFAYLHRIGGEGARGTGRVFAQLTF
jgi:hypothetical protein